MLLYISTELLVLGKSRIHMSFLAQKRNELQMFTGNYRDSTGKSECRDFKIMGIACIPAIPVIFKYSQSVILAGNLILQGFYREIGMQGFQIYGDCMYTCNPCNFEISTV